ncbi:MAG: hypothetical protein HZC11_03335 [Nitrospirae bacterium]|nr:hypothetical protein [Nitrospirota bacterium]
MHSCDKEISQGERFAFGKNWRHFPTILDEERIIAIATWWIAEQTLDHLGMR